MQKLKFCLLAIMAVSVLFFAGCGSHHEESAAIAPIHLEMSTENLQSKVGLSGFILGTFMLINAYVLIILSCVALLVKEQTFQKISDTVRMGMQMLNPSGSQDGAFLKVMALLSNAETRFQIGSAGLIIGLVLAYVGAWIAT
ncbi:MAG TPA: hypothetical protein PLA83_12260 [Deltaproteobacteria bacterium]|nr:hypothetical protein [Deltaproteobacteria bacterium]HQI01436.1 hypothetical protein [Deltaproteobacteria bacterium]HQJ07791.1 hypothetical protein [Deltaproteobacteria bacterium]